MQHTLNDTKVALDAVFERQQGISAAHMKDLEPLINRTAALGIIDSVLGDDAALAQIAQRSYAHSLGFKKIVLLDCGYQSGFQPGKKPGYQLRLHIWDAGANLGVPLVESFHEHSFDFVSHMLDGEMENQCYRAVPLPPDDRALLQRFESALQTLSEAEMREANRQIESLEAECLASIGSQQAAKENLAADKKLLSNLLKLPQQELERIVRFQGRYEALSLSRTDGDYVHRLKEMVNLVPHTVLRLHSGDTYHHPHPFAHRLYIAANQPNSTMLVSTPAVGELGGSLQRPTYTSDSNRSYQRLLYTPDELAEILATHKDYLQSQRPPGTGRSFDVATGYRTSG